jgi:hypothetical protein
LDFIAQRLPGGPTVFNVFRSWKKPDEALHKMTKIN